jgi:hypothetical protein
MSVEILTKAEAEQEAELTALNSAIAMAEADLRKISDDLKPEVAAERRAAILKAAQTASQARLEAMDKRAEQVIPLARKLTPEALRRTARFDPNPATDAAMRTNTIATLARTPTPALLEHLQDAIETRNMALGEHVRLEYQSRPTSERSVALSKQFEQAMAQLDGLRSGELQAASSSLRRIRGVPELARNRLAELITGHSNPEKRLSAFRAAGKPKSQRQAAEAQH